jgi:hypothetical protein
MDNCARSCRKPSIFAERHTFNVFKRARSGRAAFTLLFCSCLLFLIPSYAGTAQSRQSVSVSEGDEWHFMKGYSTPGRIWTRNGFDDSDWQKGPSGLGYGRNGVNTNMNDMKGNYKRVYARKKFSLDNPKRVKNMVLSLVCDGPFIAYVNGIEVIRNSVGISPPEGEPAERLDLSGFIHELLPGENVLSIQCDNDAIQSDDFLFIPTFEVTAGEGEEK